MLRACTLIYTSSCDTCLPFAQFEYNNSYQASINMSPYEALYGRDCRTPLNWSEVGERRIYGNKKVNEAEEKVKKIKRRKSAICLQLNLYDNLTSVGFEHGKFSGKVIFSNDPQNNCRKQLSELENFLPWAEILANSSSPWARRLAQHDYI